MFHRFSFVLLISISASVWAQETAGLTTKQQKLYNEVTSSVAAPCCSNAIPVAFHESGMALFMRDEVKKWILEGKSKRQIFKELSDMRLGSDKREVIFTVPVQDFVGTLTWFLPLVILVIGSIGIFLFFKHGKKDKPAPISDSALVEQFRPYILQQLEKKN